MLDVSLGLGLFEKNLFPPAFLYPFCGPSAWCVWAHEDFREPPSQLIQKGVCGATGWGFASVRV